MTTTIDPDTRSALLLIDLQEDFLGAPGLREQRDDLLTAVRGWIDWASATGSPVVEIRTVLPLDEETWALNMRDDMQPVVLEGTPGSWRVHELEVEPDVEIQKRRDDAFHRTDLAQQLSDLGVGQVVLAGVSTEACIAMTAASAYAHDLRVVVARDAVASADRTAHDAALVWLEEQYRAPALTPAEWGRDRSETSES